MHLSVSTNSSPQGSTVAALLEDAAPLASALFLPDAELPAIVGVEFYDDAAPERVAEGLLVLVPSWRALRQQAMRGLVELAAKRGAAGVVIQGGEPPQQVLAACAQTGRGVALLRLDDHITWREFEAVVDLTIGETSPSITASLLQSDYLFAIADSIAEVFGGSVAVENHARTLLAYSTVEHQIIDETRSVGIRTRQVPHAIRNHEQYRQVQFTDGPVQFPQFDAHELPRAAIAVRAGSMQLGSIWAIDPDGGTDVPLSEEKRDALERGAQSAAAHLLAAWRVSDAEARRRDAALGRMLEIAPTSGDLVALSLAPTSEVRLISLQFAGEAASPGDERQLQAFAERQLQARLSVVAAALTNGACYVAVTGATESRIRDALTATIRAAARSFTQEIRAAIACPTTAGVGFVAAREELDAILRTPHERTQPVKSSDDVRASLIADHLGQLFATYPYLQHPAVTMADGRRQRERRDTMLAWFEQGGPAGAAAHLHVHENTVRYRVQQALRDWGVQLDQPDEAFALWTTLVAWRARDRSTHTD